MIRNYILVAIRNLTRNKFFSAINIVGLAVSMTICMAIIMLVADQMTYDRHNPRRSRTFRINSRLVSNEGKYISDSEYATTPMPLRQELVENYTGIEKVVRVKRGFGNSWLELENHNNVNIPISGFYADPEVFEMFDYELEVGDPSTALREPFTVVLTRKAASKLFGDGNPLGQSLKVGDRGTFTVTGVVKETKNKSHIIFDGLASMASIDRQSKTEANDNDNWSDFWSGWTYIRLADGVSTEDIQKHFDNIYKERIATIADPEAHKSKFHLQNIMDITPGKMIGNSIGPLFPWIFVYFLGGLAGVIMLTSCFNFTNLSIARSLTRAREIGVRKATGAARWQIFLQFLIESIVVALFALACALLLLILLKPLILQLNIARILQLDLHLDYTVVGIFLMFAISVGIIGGLFPAVILSSFQPVKVLKSLSSVKLFSRVGIRKVLLVTQFSLSLIFILSVIVVNNQLNLFRTKDYGFAKEQNIIVQLNNTSAAALKTELLKYGEISSVSAASHIPAAGTSYGSAFKKSFDEKDWTSMNHFFVDQDYLKNMSLALIAGKYFPVEDEAAAKKSIVINESAVEAFHYKTPEEAIGEELILQQDSTRKTIIGVVKDYNHRILLEKIEPVALMYSPEGFRILHVKYSGTYNNAVKIIEKSWNIINPDTKIEHKTMESEVTKFYNIMFGDLVSVLGVIAFLAIMISCLGLLGMATYTIETRVKEIAIRKVLGSANKDLILLLSKGFLKLLAVSVIIGVPAAWFINDLWLEMIAYRTEISMSVILTSVSVLIGLGAITVGSQTFRAAFTNPIDNLKNE
jgi:putative ABC transport system permease protein